MSFHTDKLRCPHCPPGTSLIDDPQAGDLICLGCGLVVGDRMIDVKAEWRTFSNERPYNRSRVGAEESPLYDGLDLPTMISSTCHSGRTSVCAVNTTSTIITSSSSPSATLQQKMKVDCGSAGQGSSHNGSNDRKIRTKKYLSTAQRNLVAGFKEIAEMAEKLKATRPVVESAQFLFKCAQSHNSVRCRPRDAVAAACLFFACRQHQVPRTFKEIGAVCAGQATVKDIGRCFKLIRPLVTRKDSASENSSSNSNNISRNTVYSSSNQRPQLTDYVPRFCGHLALPLELEKQSSALLEKIDELGVLAGRSPSTIVALAIALSVAVQSSSSSTSSSSVESLFKKGACQLMTGGSVIRPAPLLTTITLYSISQVSGAAESTIKEAYQVLKQAVATEQYFAKYFCASSKF
ncbi:Transcription initiation factor IIB [Tyrophagus putrescentiae]|nr:Transcription initiation factor IIB [Tyrophagus putrescentiae]